MKRILWIAMLVLALIDLSGLPLVHAQTGEGYDLTWSTIDGGGAMNAAGGAYTLGGTLGQPDAGAAMSGGGYTLVGGFWGGAASQYQVYLPVVIR